MADKRPFAKIDTGYMMNPKWFRIERELRDSDRIDDRIDYRSLIRVAREAHIASILYCAQNVTDGLFPVDAIKAIVAVRPDEEPAITALFTVGMWVNETGGLATVHDYLEHQTSSEKVKQLSEAGKKAVSVRDAKNVSNRSSDRSSDRSTNRSSEEKRREENIYSPDSDATFLAFWAEYPRKDDRLKAFKAWTKALKVTNSETLIKAAKAYALETKGREKRYIKLGATWLNAGSWENEPSRPESVSSLPTERDPYAHMIDVTAQRMQRGERGA